MKLILTSYLLFISLLSNAKEKAEIKYFTNGEAMLIVLSKEGIDLNESCWENDCLAKKALNLKIELSKLNISGGKNPGAVACTKKLNGQILMLKEVKTHSINSYCLFNDGSFISNKTIYDKIIQ